MGKDYWWKMNLREMERYKLKGNWGAGMEVRVRVEGGYTTSFFLD